MLPVSSPNISDLERAYVNEAMISTRVSSSGAMLTRFESALTEWSGTGHALATTSGTTALHLALAALGIGPGDEVIVPDLTYVAVANAVVYCGATPVFADVEPGSLTISPAAVERLINKRTRAVIVVHLFGQPADMETLADLSASAGVHLVEDAAEAHGASYRGQTVGGLSTCGVFSFYGNKIITTGEGGAFVTNDADLAARAHQLRGQGMDPEKRYWFPVVGFNYRMTNVAAAIGVAQLERFTEIASGFESVGRWYNAEISEQGIEVLPIEPVEGARPVNWLYTTRLPQLASQRDRDRLILHLGELGVESRPVFHPLHRLPPYRRGADADWPASCAAAEKGISLPTSSLMSESDVVHVVQKLKSALDRSSS